MLIVIVSSCKKDKVTVNAVLNSVEIAGENYPTIKTGSQTWTAANFKGPGGVAYNGVEARPGYGKYYSFNEVRAIVLPAGWRIPSINDYIKLGEAYGVEFTDHTATNQAAAKKLVSTTPWLNVKGNNESGLNAYPANYIYNNSTPIEGDISEFWTSEGNTFSIQESAEKGSLRLLFYDDSSSDGYKFNVRFVKDN
ncbi:MAG: FISUMP domain-containing protein [Chitinophagaceae bacterium]